MDISWKFCLSEPMASISQVSLKERIDFWPEPGKFWFYGYETIKDKKVKFWGRRVTFSFQISPLNTPREKYPISPGEPPKPKISELSPERRLQLEEFQVRLKSLQATVPPPLADESVYWNYVDAKVFVGTFQQMATKWNDKNIELIDKFPLVTPLLITIYDAVKDMKLPDELMRDDTKFCLGLARILQYVEIIAENAELHHQVLPPEIDKLKVFLDELTDRMIEGGHKMFGIPPVVDEELSEAFHLKTVSAVYGSTVPLDERLEMCNQLFEDPCADIHNKIEFLETAIKYIWKEVEKKGKNPVCPHKELITAHLEGIRLYMKNLEEGGQEIWQLRIAEELLDSANAWRESPDLPLLSKDEFASLIFLTNIHIESKEMEDGTISYNVDLSFKDKADSFYGHIIYVEVVNDEVKDITLFG